MARRRAGRAERRDAAQRQAADRRRAEAPVVPQVIAGPRVLALQARDPTHEEVVTYVVDRPRRNRETRAELKRRQWLPLPPGAPKIEETVFKFVKSAKTGNEVADIMLTVIVDDSFNDVQNKRRELLHSQTSSKADAKDITRLSNELAGLVAKARRKIQELDTVTGYVVGLPEHFNYFPALLK